MNARRNTATRDGWNRIPEDTERVRTDLPGSYAPRKGSTRPLLVLLLLGAGTLSGCAGRDGRVILTSSNGYAFHEARHSERCQIAGASPECRVTYNALTRWKKALDEAAEAYKRGGKLPDQLGALKAAENEARKAPW